jgi:hypothetical protein
VVRPEPPERVPAEPSAREQARRARGQVRRAWPRERLAERAPLGAPEPRPVDPVIVVQMRVQ